MKRSNYTSSILRQNRCLYSAASLILLVCFLLQLNVQALETGHTPDRKDADRQFKDASFIVSCADETRNDENEDEAIILYEAALKVYAMILAEYPDWKSEQVRIQQRYCKTEVASLKLKESPLSDKVEAPVVTNTPPPPETIQEAEAPPGPPVEWLSWQPDNRQGTNATTGLKATVRQMFMAGLTDEARALLLGAIKDDPDNPEVRLLLGVAQCQAGRFSDALFLLEELVEETPTNALAHVCMGTAYFGLNRLIDAADAMKNALALDPDLSEAHYNLAQILLRTDPPDITGARRHYQEAIELGSAEDKTLAESLK